MSTPRPKTTFLAPEVVQSSAMDCGPAALKSLLEGFGVNVSYDRLRGACQTDVDGTSIDTLEDVAVQLGLDAEQVVVPADHVLLPSARTLPALTVVQLPSGLTHFVVIWRTFGDLVQLMDPGTGRRWVRRQQLLQQLYQHEMLVPAQAWHEWTTSTDFAEPFAARLRALGATQARAATIVRRARSEGSWYAVAALDAAARMVDDLVRARAVTAGRGAVRLVEQLALAEQRRGPAQSIIVPEQYWSALPAPDDDEGQHQIRLRGAVLVRVRGRRQQAAILDDTRTAVVSFDELSATAHQPNEDEAPQQLSYELAAALEEKPLRPARELLRLLFTDGALAPALVFMALLLASAGVMVEALIFRGLFDLGRELDLTEQRLGALTMLVAFVGAMALLEVPVVSLVRRMGRHLEVRLRHAFLVLLPQLPDSYFSSRLTSDMAERSHSIHGVRDITELSAAAMRAAFGLILTAGGLIWLDPASWPAVALAVVVSAALPWLVHPLLRERDLRVRSHQGALTRFYLDALLGAIPLRTHGANAAVRQEHEDLLNEWTRAHTALLRLVVPLSALTALVGMTLAGILLLGYVGRNGQRLDLLLFAYWALNLPAMGGQLAAIAAQVPVAHNLTKRLLEPFASQRDQPEADAVENSAPTLVPGGRPTSDAVRIELREVTLKLGGQRILEGINLEVPAGQHLAVVGPSGAGKSSLLGMLLGWTPPAYGSILVDGAQLDTAGLQRLRRHTAWVDPSVQLWNRSLLENLRYGSPQGQDVPFAEAMDAADLHRVLDGLPEGLQSILGEGGALVSGGEGQRVRLARALLRPDVQLALLDEPFRGLDREKRRLLLDTVRHWWRDATLICVTHDIVHTTDFDRVAVVQEGRVVEVGAPAVLLGEENSNYRALIRAEQRVHHELWENHRWRHLRVERGQVHESREVKA